MLSALPENLREKNNNLKGREGAEKERGRPSCFNLTAKKDAEETAAQVGKPWEQEHTPQDRRIRVAIGV